MYFRKYFYFAKSIGNVIYNDFGRTSPKHSSLCHNHYLQSRKHMQDAIQLMEYMKNEIYYKNLDQMNHETNLQKYLNNNTILLLIITPILLLFKSVTVPS